MCNCDDCEQWMQPYMDRVLTDAERLANASTFHVKHSTPMLR